MNPVIQNRFNYDVDFPPLKQEEAPKKGSNDKSTAKVSTFAHQQIKEVTTPSPEGEGFLGLLPGHLVRGPKCLTMH